jgi:FMN reductase
MYNPDDERDPPPAASTLIEACHDADGMLWSSPMYQGTISGAFKNALDWLHALGSREPPFLHDEVIGLISAAGGTQGLQVINTMEFAVRALRGWAVPYVVPVASAFRVFDSEGRVNDEGVELQLRTLGAEVVRVATRFADHVTPQRARECEESAERVAAAAVATTTRS